MNPDEMSPIDDAVEKYKTILLKYNEKVNLVSRKMTDEGLRQLVDETFFLEKYISCDEIVDAGSGNGLLGFPIALLNKEKKVALVEPRKKKIEFLNEVKKQMELTNVSVHGVSIEEFLKNNRMKKITLIARGFPDLSVFCRFVKNRLIEEAVLLTSLNKIKKIRLHLETVGQKTYNVPLRNYLKILKIIRMENTARGN